MNLIGFLALILFGSLANSVFAMLPAVDRCGQLTTQAATSAPYVSRILGSSPAIQKLRELIARVATSDIPVMIVGETGSGKELVAADIHYLGRRADKPYLPKNCGGVNHELLGSELFGHEKGAFTGAFEQRIGYFELGDGGTVFLDEVGDTPWNMQTFLLRVLETKSFERLGGKKTIKSDFRIITATNVNMREAVNVDKTFREDLYYRLAVVTINVPSLRERLEDIPELLTHFSKKAALEHGLTDKPFSSEAIARLMQHAWPGNVRELQNVVYSSLFQSTDAPEVLVAHLPDFGVKEAVEKPIENDDLPTFDEAEFMLIKRALLKAGGKGIKEASRLLQTTERSLKARMRRLNISEK